MTKIFISIYFLVFLSACTNSNNKPFIQPNVLFILVDDLGLRDLAVTGSEFYETPNIDQLAQQSMTFTQGYAASRVCSPSRASIMTGKFTANHGITDWIGAKSGKEWRTLQRHDKLLPAEYQHQLPSKDISLAEAMKSAGYQTFFAGKWHLGGEGSFPENHGFDINKGGFDKGSPNGGYFSPWINPKLKNNYPGENLSMRLAQETINFMEENKEKPFFAFLSFYAVHAPIQTTKEKWNKYRNKAQSQGLAKNGFEMEKILPIRQKQDNPIYAGLVESMDDAVGYVLRELDNLDLDENTIVVFTSDNGGVSSGDAFSTSNLPLRGGKGYQWEGGTRVPFFIKVPWLENENLSNDYPVIGTDFYPTLLELTKLDLLEDQHQNGLSLVPLLDKSKEKLENRALFWHYPHYGNQGGEPSSMIRENDWKLIHYWEDSRNELYHLIKDPNEGNNLIEEQKELSEKLEKKLLEYLQNSNSRIPKIDLEYDSKLAKNRTQKMHTELLPKHEENRKSMLSEDFQPNADWWGSFIIEE